MGTAGKPDYPADPPDPTDPADPRHGAWCITPETFAPEVRMRVLLNKLTQTRFPDFQAFPSADEFSDPNLTPRRMHPGIKYVARGPVSICPHQAGGIKDPPVAR